MVMVRVVLMCVGCGARGGECGGGDGGAYCGGANVWYWWWWWWWCMRAVARLVVGDECGGGACGGAYNCGACCGESGGRECVCDLRGFGASVVSDCGACGGGLGGGAYGGGAYVVWW